MGTSTASQIETQELMPGFGVEISGVDISRADEDQLAQVNRLLQQHGAIVLRNQRLDKKALLRFTKAFGTPEQNAYPEWCDPEYPEIYIISNKIENGRRVGDPTVGLNWHTDLNYQERPALCTILYALEVPEVGSDTLLADGCAAWEALPPARQAQLDGLKVQYSFSKLNDERGRPLTEQQRQAYPDVVHPLVRRHAFDRRKALWVSAPIVSRAVIGWPQETAMQLIEELMNFATQDRFVYTHKWRVGDLLVWDNRCTLHSGTQFDMDKYIRYVRRTWVRGEIPI
jgi:taurine dioxygenase